MESSSDSQKVDKPILIVRYEIKNIKFYILLIFFALLFFSFAVIFVSKHPNESYIEYVFFKIVVLIFVLFNFYLLFDILNTDRFEIYKNRIEKKVRIFKSLAILGNKKVYFKNAYFRHNGLGITICNCKYLLQFRGIILFTLLLSKEDGIKVAEFLEQISGIDRLDFLRFGFNSLVKKFRYKDFRY